MPVPADLSSKTPANIIDIAPEAIPVLRSKVEKALIQLDQQIEHAITMVRVRPWAGDPISRGAATTINSGRAGSSNDVLDVLNSYQRKLKKTLDDLLLIERQYQLVESGNTTSITVQGGC